MNRVVPFLLIASSFACGACGATADDNPKPFQVSSSTKKEKTDTSTDKGDDDDNSVILPPTVSSPVAAVDAGTGSSATTYVGTLDATPTKRFGGSPYCFYDETLKSVTIEISALPSGQVIGATVKDTSVEAVVSPCTLSPAPPSEQTFAFTTMTETADGAQLAFNGAPGNHPATKLVVDIKKAGASYTAAANWHRTDQKAPLDWTVTTQITLGPR